MTDLRRESGKEKIIIARFRSRNEEIERENVKRKWRDSGQYGERVHRGQQV